MKHLKRCISLMCVLCMVLLAFSGCGDKKETATFEAPESYENVQSGTVAENNAFSMSWNAERAAVIITEKGTGKTWATTPVDYLNKPGSGESLAEQERLNSSVMVKCRNASQEFEYSAAASSIAMGTFSSEKMANGISVTYYFAEYEFYLTVDYYLEDNSFKVSVDPSKVHYFGETTVLNVTPAQFFCSTENTAAGSKDSYLTVPSGRGALMYTDRRSDGATRLFSGSVYSRDFSNDIYALDTNNNTVTLPVYGVKSGNNALCAIIEQGAESCAIEARAGDVEIGYSYISATYDVTGYCNIFNKNSSHVQVNTEPETKNQPLIIGYYALNGNDASYAGMAKLYRNYLTEKQGMEKSQDNTLLTVRLYGNALEADLFLGFPKKKEIALTTYQEAEAILKELSTVSGGNLAAEMYGYGEGGINATKLAGNYKLTGAAGGKKDLKNFVKFAGESGIKTYFDFNTITYSAGSNGFSVSKSSAANVSGAQATLRQFNIANRARLQKGIVSVMVRRSLLSKATLKTVDVADKYGISGISFSTLGNMKYSDYNSKNYYALSYKMGADVGAIIADVRSNSKTVMIDGGVSYAAAAADVLNSCPTYSGEYFAFDDEIPLYQMVFQGTKANSVTAINTATDSREQFLKAIESGSGLSFDIIANYNTDLRTQIDTKGLQSMLYSDNKAKITEYVKAAQTYLASVAGAKIVDHKILGNGITKTEFDNGVKVYVNFNETAVNCEAGSIAAQSFTVK